MADLTATMGGIGSRSGRCDVSSAEHGNEFDVAQLSVRELTTMVDAVRDGHVVSREILQAMWERTSLLYGDVKAQIDARGEQLRDDHRLVKVLRHLARMRSRIEAAIHRQRRGGLGGHKDLNEQLHMEKVRLRSERLASKDFVGHQAFRWALCKLVANADPDTCALISAMMRAGDDDGVIALWQRLEVSP